jgi:hypothetical protein
MMMHEDDGYQLCQEIMDLIHREMERSRNAGGPALDILPAAMLALATAAGWLLARASVDPHKNREKFHTEVDVCMATALRSTQSDIAVAAASCALH